MATVSSDSKRASTTDTKRITAKLKGRLGRLLEVMKFLYANDFTRFVGLSRVLAIHYTTSLYNPCAPFELNILCDVPMFQVAMR